MADSNIRVAMDADMVQLFQAFSKVITKAKEMEGGISKIAAETKKVTKEEKEFAREAKRAYDDIRGPQERHEQRMRALNDLVHKGSITQIEYAAAARRSQEALTGAGKAGEGVFGRNALAGIASMGAGFLSVGLAVGRIKQGLQNWLENLRAISAEANKASTEIVAFAALQEGGKKRERVMQAAAVGQKYGVTDRARAFDVVQGMQSATGDFKKGLQIAESIFAAGHAGMKLEDAREIATLAQGLGFDPQLALRRAHVAGEASMRTPKELAKAGAGLKYWQDRQVGWAAAAALAGQVSAEKLETFTKRGGMALMQVPGKPQEAFEAIGLGKAGQFERLKALHERGIDTIEKAMQFGFTEIREAEAVAGLAARFGKGPQGEPGVQQIYEAIRREAKPGLFVKERAAMEEELPTLRGERELAILKTKVADERAFGHMAENAQEAESYRRRYALALTRTGKLQHLFFNLVTPEGDLTTAGVFYRFAERSAGRETPEMRAAAIQIYTEMSEASRELKEAAKDLRSSTRQRPVETTN